MLPTGRQPASRELSRFFFAAEMETSSRSLLARSLLAAVPSRACDKFIGQGRGFLKHSVVIV